MQGEDIENRGREKPNRATESGSPDGTERGWISWLIPVFVLVNIVLFGIVMWFNNCPKQINSSRDFDGDGGGKCMVKFLGRFSFQPMKENPSIGPSSATLQRLGALNWNKVVYQHQGWRLISCIWLHAGVIHLLVNMISLVFIGIRLEQQFGFLRIGIIYLVSGLGGSILSSLFIRDRISVGASGALFGLLGAMMAELITNWSIYTNKCAVFCSLLLIVVLNLAIGILPRVDNFAHIGGFMTGLLLGFILLARPQFGWIKRHKRPAGVHGRSKYKLYQYVLMVLSVILLVTGLTVGLVMLLRGENGYDHCKWCHYLSCVPTSRWKCNR